MFPTLLKEPSRRKPKEKPCCCQRRRPLKTRNAARRGPGSTALGARGRRVSEQRGIAWDERGIQRDGVSREISAGDDPRGWSAPPPPRGRCWRGPWSQARCSSRKVVRHRQQGHFPYVNQNGTDFAARTNARKSKYSSMDISASECKSITKVCPCESRCSVTVQKVSLNVSALSSWCSCWCSCWAIWPQEVELSSGSRRVAGSIPPWACRSVPERDA